MLKDVVELQDRAVRNIVSALSDKREISFRAPTGSGKTYMMADFMNRYLTDHDDVVFIVSSLSKGDLARQNYEKFREYQSTGEFNNLNPHLISTEFAEEEKPYIPSGYNVYVLPRDLYKKGGKLMQGAMDAFLDHICFQPDGFTRNKRIVLIKDECHILTKNLDSISDAYFEKIINVSATLNLKRGQLPDVEITDEEAENANLIKRIQWGDDSDGLDVALSEYRKIQNDYVNLLGVNPCLIIQISNKDKADDEWNNSIKPLLERTENESLKWIYIVDKASECETNDSIGKKLPPEKWKDYAKQDSSTINVIIFKMVISEGWDIRRACMLYQVRDTKSVQLDEQVMGRVRRNPRLLDFERLSFEAKQLAMKAWIWGIRDNSDKKTFIVRRKGTTEVPSEIALNTVVLKPLEKKRDFDIEAFLDSCPDRPDGRSVFTLRSMLEKTDSELRDLCYKYSGSDYKRWFKFVRNLEKIKTVYDTYICDYDESMELAKKADGEEMLVSFPVESVIYCTDDYLSVPNWVWKRNDCKTEFFFDSHAEMEWANVLKSMCRAKIIKHVMIDGEKMYLCGKNLLYNSNIRYEYYLDGVRSSYPDFVMKDSSDRIHLFEVKSLDRSSKNIDEVEYAKKVNALEECYLHCSKLTDYCYHLPVYQDGRWSITTFVAGSKETYDEDGLFDYVAGE